MSKFNSKTASQAGKKSKRGPSKITLTMRQFIFELLQENKQRLKYMLGELSPRQFVDVYLRLIPYIISVRQLQKFDVSELSQEQTTELIKDALEENGIN